MISFADWGMRSELAKIWEICFQEPARPAKYFLNNYFSPQNCLVYRIRGKIASVVYILPTQIASGSNPLQAHYIYAAATIPQYRGRGYMAALLAAAAIIGAKCGDQFSVVLPADSNLYRLYQKSDYIKFFNIKKTTLSIDEMSSLAENGIINKTLLTYGQINSLRNSKLLKIPGSVLWSNEGIGFALGMGKIYDDKIICSRTKGKPAYAYCRKINDNVCMVMEIMADSSTIHNLAANIISIIPAQKYVFRLPNDYTIFGNKSNISCFGMIKPIGGSSLNCIGYKTGMPYLGLPLD